MWLLDVIHEQFGGLGSRCVGDDLVTPKSVRPLRSSVLPTRPRRSRRPTRSVLSPASRVMRYGACVSVLVHAVSVGTMMVSPHDGSAILLPGTITHTTHAAPTHRLEFFPELG